MTPAFLLRALTGAVAVALLAVPVHASPPPAPEKPVEKPAPPPPPKKPPPAGGAAGPQSAGRRLR
ncbi:NitT/TauT family transport system substrate-binding protein [Rhodopseudomonas pseudopalustris]|uniref:NitT/TauT family transport system substrate-binding protein n=1 Tax=Rhodopseudomonas pseudopalustris TaxID=1513892 RepID=A0A1H8MP82_9BRAD|nr:NitT/TauT family transport system substrate-binding protein [Rhodopseudomonas pseudopalustris]